MPRIQQFVAQVSATGPMRNRPAYAADFGGGGEGFQQGGKAIADFAETLEKRNVDADVSGVRLAVSKAQSEWLTELQTRSEKAGDGAPDFTGTVLKDFDEYVTKAREGVRTEKGQQVFDERFADARLTIFSKAMAFEAGARASKTKNDFLTGLNDDRNTVLTDPTMLNSVMANRLDAVEELTLPGNEKAVLKEQVRTEMGLSAVQGRIRQDPVGTLAQLEKGAFNSLLDADKTASLIGEAKTAVRGQEVEIARKKAEAKEQKEVAILAKQDEFIGRIYQPGNNPLTVPEILADQTLPAVGQGSKQYLIELLKQKADGADPKRLDVPLVTDLWAKVSNGEIKDERDLLPHLYKGLPDTNYNSMREEIRRGRVDDTEKTLKKAIVDAAKSAVSGTNSLIGLRDPKGDEQFLAFMSWFMPEYDRQKGNGKSALELLDPASKDYLGKAIDRFKRPPNVFMKDLIDNSPGMYDPGVDAPGGGTAPKAPAAYPDAKWSESKKGWFVQRDGKWLKVKE